MRKFCRTFGLNLVDGAAPDYKGWCGPLSGCENDAQDIAMMLAENYGYESKATFSGWNVGSDAALPMNEWVMTLDCTWAAYVKAHTDLQSIVRAGDMVVIHFSGHGYQYPLALVGHGEGACFCDRMVPDHELFTLVLGWLAGVNVIYIDDACYSGGYEKSGMMPCRPRVMPSWLTPAAPPIGSAMRSADVRGNVIRLEACQTNQTAADGPVNGAFSSTILAVLEQFKARGERIHWGTLARTVERLVPTYWEQVPKLNILGGGASVLDLEV